MNPAVYDLTNVDDIRGLSVTSIIDAVVFKIIAEDNPADPAGQGTGEFCWFAGFEIGEPKTEYLGMACAKYTNGAFDGWIAQMNSNR